MFVSSSVVVCAQLRAHSNMRRCVTFITGKLPADLNVITIKWKLSVPVFMLHKAKGLQMHVINTDYNP